MDLTKLSLLELRRTRAPKYDVMLKRFFSFRYSSLRKMLGVPDGVRLTEETGTFDDLRMDAVVLSDGALYHIEFQAQNHSLMHERMLGYYRSLATKYTDLKTMAGPDIKQCVLYVGPGKIRMVPYIVRDRFHFSYRMRSIRAFNSGWRCRLERSPYPEDWILSLLTIPEGAHIARVWKEVATTVANLPIDRPENAETSALLLIACILRNLPNSIQREISSMLKIDVSQSQILMEVFQQGANVKETEVILQRIDQILENNKLEMDPDKREDLSSANDVDIDIFFNEFVMAVDKQDFLDNWSIGLRY